MVFVTLLNSGLPLTISKITASNKVSQNYASTYSAVHSSLRLEIILCLLLVAITLIFKNVLILFLGSEFSYYMFLTLIPAIICAGIYSPFKGYLWGEEQYFKVSLVEFIEQIIKMIVLIILASIGSNMESLLPLGWAISISAILSTIIGIVFYFTQGGRLSKSNLQYKPIISSALPLTTTRLCGSLMNPLISIILPFRLVAMGYTKSQALSMLGIAMGMAFPILTVPSTLIGSLSMALIPEIATMLESGNSKSLHRQINSSILFTMCCSFICVPILVALSEPICMILFNNYEAGIYLKYAAWTIIPTGLSSITTSILNSLGKEKQTFIYFIISSVITLLIVLLTPKFLGIHSLFVALGIGMTITFILNIYTIQKTLKFKHHTFKYMLKLIIITIPTTLLAMWLYNIFIIMYGDIIAMIISAIITTMSFIFLLVAFNLLDISVIIQTLKRDKKQTKTC